jgi:putative ABC transport system ATP-binding protein
VAGVVVPAPGGDAVSEARPIMEARGACKLYGAGAPAEVRALDGADLAVGRGSFTVLVGPSGSGKTTLLSLLGALDRPTRGDVLFDGQLLAVCSDAELTRVRRRVGFVFQDAGLLPGLAAWENVAYPLIPRGVGRSARRARATELLARLGLESRAGVRAGLLSGGECQRVAVARALVARPEVLIADEPTAALDPESARAVIEALTEARRVGATVLASSHDPAVVELATCVVELSAGRVVRSRATPR